MWLILTLGDCERWSTTSLQGHITIEQSMPFIKWWSLFSVECTNYEVKQNPHVYLFVYFLKSCSVYWSKYARGTSYDWALWNSACWLRFSVIHTWYCYNCKVWAFQCCLSRLNPPSLSSLCSLCFNPSPPIEWESFSTHLMFWQYIKIYLIDLKI